MEKKYVCKFCNKECPSGKSLGGHIRSHTNEYSDTYNAQRRFFCRECGKGFGSLKALCGHMDCHSKREKKIVLENQSDTENSLLMKQSNSEIFTNGSLSSSASEIDEDDKNGALSLMIMYRESSSLKKGQNLVVNSLAESSDNNSGIVETKSSAGEELKMLKDDKVAVDEQLSSCDSDYFMNGPKKSESDISVDGSLRNSGFKRFRDSDEFVVKEGGSKYELMSKSKRVFHFHEADSCDRSSERKSPMVKKASGTKKKSNGHECPFCDRVFKSGQALGGHKRSHSIGNQEHKVAEKCNLFDLNIPAPDTDE